jgi:hypothetical protein
MEANATMEERTAMTKNSWVEIISGDDGYATRKLHVEEVPCGRNCVKTLSGE